MGRRRALLTKGVLIAWVVSLALGTRYVFGEPQDFGANQHLEYIRYFLPLSVVTSWLLVAVLRRYTPRISGVTYGLLLALAVAVGVGASTASRPGLSVWWFGVVASYAIAGCLTARAIRAEPALRSVFLATVTATAVAEGVLGLLQFAAGHTFGLSILGEPIADAQTVGVAKIIVDGARVLRPVGTFAHANIFGGFAVVGLLASSFATTSTRWSSQLVYKLSIGLIVLSIVASFSRSAWLAAAISVVAIFVLAGRRRWLFLGGVLPALLLCLFFWLPMLTGRLLLTEQTQQFAVRDSLTQEGIAAVTERPLFGVGFRNFVSFVEARHPDWYPFELQPVHSVPGLLLSELGVIGFSLIVAASLWLARRNQLVLAAGVTSLAPLMLLDHYTMTTPQGLGVLVLFILLMGIYAVPRGTALVKPKS